VNLGLVTSPRFAEHTPPAGHAERPERADVMDVVAGQWRTRGAQLVEPEPAGLDVLARVHVPAYLDRLAETAGHARMLDLDTFTSPESWEIARLAAGAAVRATRMVLDGQVARSAALVRPPGHHALPDRAMGFCLLNNVAVAAADAIARGVPRVAIVDIDVHHGNGTQAMFEANPRVLYVSTHQWPCYPGTGVATETGRGAGEGFTVNVPLPPGCTDVDYDLAFERVVLPVLRAFEPDLLFLSAGFDAHEMDPLARMRVSEAGFDAMTRRLSTVADASCDGRMVLVTEGGYDLPAFAASLDAALGAMAGTLPAVPGEVVPADADTSAGAQRMIAEARAIQARYWRGL
jgi:acetoin utilization deacetylase AcuC-like enzyme